MFLDTIIISALYYIIKPFSKYWEPTINLNLLQPQDFEKKKSIKIYGTGLVYLPTNLRYKSTIHVGKNAMDPMGILS